MGNHFFQKHLDVHSNKAELDEYIVTKYLSICNIILMSYLRSALVLKIKINVNALQ